MMLLGYIAAFFIIRAGFLSEGNGSFLASVSLALGLGSFATGLWYYGIPLIGLSFLIASTGKSRGHV